MHTPIIVADVGRMCAESPVEVVRSIASLCWLCGPDVPNSFTSLSVQRIDAKTLQEAR
jgi:hypothetical protein